MSRLKLCVLMVVVTKRKQTIGRKMDEKRQLQAHIAKLETHIDFLETQFGRLDEMLRAFGFDEGIKTLGETLNEVLETEEILRRDYE